MTGRCGSGAIASLGKEATKDGVSLQANRSDPIVEQVTRAVALVQHRLRTAYCSWDRSMALLHGVSDDRKVRRLAVGVFVCLSDQMQKLNGILGACCTQRS